MRWYGRQSNPPRIAQHGGLLPRGRIYNPEVAPAAQQLFALRGGSPGKEPAGAYR